MSFQFSNLLIRLHSIVKWKFIEFILLLYACWSLSHRAMKEILIHLVVQNKLNQIDLLRTRAAIVAPVQAIITRACECAITLALAIIDMYIRLLGLLHRLYIRALVFGCRAVSPHTRGPHIMCAFARESGANITLAVKIFYATDSILSVASLYRWLQEFDNVDQTVDLIFYRDGAINVSRIDLDADRELITETQIHCGDIELKSLPAAQLHGCGERTQF